MVDKMESAKSRRGRGRKSKDGARKKRSNSISSLEDKGHKSVLQCRPHKSLLINLTDETPTWYECGRHTPGRDDTIYSGSKPLTLQQQQNCQQLASRYREVSNDIYRTEVQLFSHGSQGGTSSSDQRWMESTMKRGTLKDRIAAMSVVVNTNPVHKLYALDSLLQLAGCTETNPGQANTRVSQMAAEALADLFENTLLPSHRKLYSLDQRPLCRYSSEETGNEEEKKTARKTLSPRILMLWRYEEMIKEKYQLFVRCYLTHTLREGHLEMSKIFALRTSGVLLRSLPECEAQLLSIMVNKLGDPAKKVAAVAGHELRRILEQHPSMQLVLAREVQQLSHRPHLSPRALYNCIIFLNQLKLHQEEAEEQILPESGGNEEASDSDDNNKVSHTSKMSNSLPASLINTYFRLFEVAVSRNTAAAKKKDSNNEVSSTGMKSRLLSALLTGVNRAHPFLPEKDKRMEQHIDTLYRIVHTAPPSACTQALMLLFHLAVGSELDGQSDGTFEQQRAKSNTVGTARFYRALYSTLSLRPLVSSGKHLTMFFNLLYKAMKNDADSVRVIAMAKRLLCTTMSCGAPVLAASLFLLNEVMKYHPALEDSVAEVAQGRLATAMLDPTKREPRAALVWVDDSKKAKTKTNGEESPDGAPLWEVSLISHHFHPSVSKFATTLSDITYSGDPLRDFSLAPFLDKFAYKNPKSAKSIAQHWKRGESVAERRSGTEGEIEALMSLPVNDPAFIAKQDFTEQEEFFHKFFVERARRDEIKGVVRGKGSLGDLDNDEDDDEEERRAFDEAEAKEMTHDFDADIETDSEEEAFVNSLAEKLMEDSGHGKANYDDEDPDMEGWSDIDYDIRESDDSVERNASSATNQSNDHAGKGDEDAFMDSSEARSGDDSSEADADVDLALITDSDSDDEEDDDGKNDSNKKLSESFVDAAEYEAIIEKSWNRRKRPTNFPAGVAIGSAGIEPEEKGSEERKRKRRKRDKDRSV